MANEEHLQLLQSGAEDWNQWRKDNPDVVPDLNESSIRAIGAEGEGKALEEPGPGGALTLGNLGEYNLEGVLLVGADLNQSNLMNVDFTGARLTGAKLISTDLKGAKFKHADMSGADLTGAQSVSWTQFGLANLSEATLPEGIEPNFPEGLDAVEKVAKHCRGLFIIMISAALVVFLKLVSLTGRDLVLGDTQLTLPIVGNVVSSGVFIIAMPFLLLALYLYFHFYLSWLWERIAILPAVFPDGRSLYTASYPWLLSAIIPAHLHRFSTAENRSILQYIIATFLAWYAIPVVLIIFQIRVSYTYPYRTWLCFAISCFGVFFLVHFRMKMTMLWGSIKRSFFVYVQQYWPPIVLFLIAVLHLWMLLNDSGVTVHSNVVAEGGKFQTRHMAKVNLRWAYLVGANFEQARMPEADFNHANLRKTNFRKADLRGANLIGADLCDANLEGADLSNADLRGTDLKGTILKEAVLRGVYFGYTNLRGRDFRNMKLRLTRFSEADLVGADFSGANLIEAFFGAANLSRANFSGANLESANLWGANLRGANLSGTNLENARYNTNTRFPKGFDPRQQNMRFSDIKLIKNDFLLTLPHPTNSGPTQTPARR